MEKRYTIDIMIGNANSPHTMNLMQGIFHAAKSMDVNVLFFLGFTVVITINLILAKIRICLYMVGCRNICSLLWKWISELPEVKKI